MQNGTSQQGQAMNCESEEDKDTEIVRNEEIVVTLRPAPLFITTEWKTNTADLMMTQLT